jgi:hypothetical protein
MGERTKVERRHAHLSEQNWAGALWKSQNTLEVVLSVSYIVDLAYKYTNKINYQLLVRVLKKMKTGPVMAGLSCVLSLSCLTCLVFVLLGERSSLPPSHRA